MQAAAPVTNCLMGIQFLPMAALVVVGTLAIMRAQILEEEEELTAEQAVLALLLSVMQILMMQQQPPPVVRRLPSLAVTASTNSPDLGALLSNGTLRTG